MKSTQAKAYINESLLIVKGCNDILISPSDAARAVEIAESDMLVGQHDRHRDDLQFLDEMLDKFDTQQMDLVRQNIVDWRDELERKVADLKWKINA